MLLCKVLYRQGFKDSLGKSSGVVYAKIVMQAGRPEVCVNHADGPIASSSQDHSRADTNRSTPRITLHCGKQDDLRRTLPSRRKDAVDQPDFFLAGNGFEIGPAPIGLLLYFLPPTSGLLSNYVSQMNWQSLALHRFLLRLLAPRRTRFEFCRA